MNRKEETVCQPFFLENKQMTAGFDPETGKLISIRMKGDPLKTEYIGNRKNIPIRPFGKQISGWEMSVFGYGMKRGGSGEEERNGEIPKITEL